MVRATALTQLPTCALAHIRQPNLSTQAKIGANKPIKDLTYINTCSDITLGHKSYGSASTKEVPKRRAEAVAMGST